MKRLFSTFKAKAVKALLAVVVLLSFSTQAFATSTYWYAFYGKMQTYPSGAGKVYAELGTSYVTTDANGTAFSDYSTPAEDVDVIFVSKGVQYGYYTAKAEPADGWYFAGWYNSIKHEDGNFEMGDSIVSTSESNTSLNVISTTQSEDSLAILSMIPFSPDTIHYAVFSRVVPAVAPGQNTLGTVKYVLKDNASQAMAEGDYRAAGLCNDLGDDVTMLATPSEAMNAKFEYWENPATGETFTDNPLTIKNIKSAAHYEAHFSSPDMKTIEFPEEGGYKFLTFDKGYQFDATGQYDYQDYEMSSFQVYGGGWSSAMYPSYYSDTYYVMPGNYNYIYANHGVLVYGKGTCTFTRYPDYDTTDTESYLGYTSDGDATVASLIGDTEAYIYSIDMEGRKYNLMSSADVVPANTVYLKLPVSELTDNELTEAPAILYFDPQLTDPTAISSVAAEVKNTVKGGIYTIDGKRLTKATKPGLYIINGKKVMK